MGYSNTEGFIPGKNKYGNNVPQDAHKIKVCKCGRLLIKPNSAVKYSSNMGINISSVCVECEGCSQKYGNQHIKSEGKEDSLTNPVLGFQ